MTITGLVVFRVFNFYFISTPTVILSKNYCSISCSSNWRSSICCVIYPIMSSYCVKYRMSSIEVIFGAYVTQFNWGSKKSLFHVFALTHFALDKLVESKGNVINIGSKVAVTGQGGTSGYAACKGAMNALTREWALDLADRGVRVNSVIPAEVMTPMYKRWLDSLEDPDATLRSIEENVPLGKRMTTDSEIADAVLFLASARSSHTSGQIFYPDGGYVHFDRAYGKIKVD